MKQQVRLLPQKSHCGSNRVYPVGFSHIATGLFLWRLDLNHPNPISRQGAADRGSVGVGSFDDCQNLAGADSANPGDGAGRPGLGYEEGLTTDLGTVHGVHDGVGGGAKVGVDADNVLVFFCHYGDDGGPAFQSVAVDGGIGLN